MTEKRFSISSSYLGLYTVFDDKNGYPLSDYELLDLLNEQHEIITDLTESLSVASNREISKDDLIERLQKENEQLKSKYSEQCIQLDFLKDENQHMRDLVNENRQLKERNDRQAKRLDDLYRLIEQKDWRALTDIMDDFQKAEKQLQSEWQTYCDDGND